MTYDYYWRKYSLSENYLALHEAAWLLSEGIGVKQDLNKAIDFCKELIKRKYKLSFFLLANCYQKQKKYKLAIENYFLGIKFFRKKIKFIKSLSEEYISESYFNIAKCYEFLNKFKEAVNIYKTIKNLDYISKNIKIKSNERTEQIKKMQEFGICIN